MTTNSPGTNSSSPATADHTTDHVVFVVGGGPVGRDVATRLADAGTTVTVVDRGPVTDPPPNQTCRQVEDYDALSLAAVDFDDATTAFILEPNDGVNLLVAQLAKTRFDVDRVLVLVNDPDRASVYESLDVETVDATGAIAESVADRW